MNTNQTEKTREDFCGACVAAPLAVVGAGVAGAGVKKKGSHNKSKKIMLWGGISLAVVSILVTIYFWTRCKSCR